MTFLQSIKLESRLNVELHKFGYKPTSINFFKDFKVSFNRTEQEKNIKTWNVF